MFVKPEVLLKKLLSNTGMPWKLQTQKGYEKRIMFHELHYKISFLLISMVWTYGVSLLKTCVPSIPGVQKNPKTVRFV